MKRRPQPDVSEVTHVVGDVNGKTAVVVDDMISTGGTLVKAAEKLIELGATEVYTLATHGIFAGDAIEQLQHSPIKKVIVPDTIPRASSIRDAIDSSKIEILPISQTIADAIRRITSNRSVSELFAQESEENPPFDSLVGREAVAAI